MEKKIWFTRTEIIKWAVFLATVISSYFALLNRIHNLEEKDILRDKDYKELKIEMQNLKFEQQETGKEVSMINGKLDEIKTTVNNIADAIFNNQLNPNRGGSR